MSDQTPSPSDSGRPAQQTLPPPESHVPQHDVSSDPTDGYEPIPLWLISIFGALLAWAGWYVGTYNGGWNWLELEERAVTGAAAPQAEEDPIALGKRIFTARCVSCHQASGQGLPGQYPPLTGSEWVHGNPAWMKRIVLHGLEGPITVKGQQFSGTMPAFGAQINDKQIAAVISYVRTNADWGNSSGAVAAESVAATREATKGRTTAWNPAELQAITQDEGPAAPASGQTTQPGAGQKGTGQTAAGQAAPPATGTAPTTR